MYSIYHFFAHLIRDKDVLSQVEMLESYPFPQNLLACRNKGRFPDLAIRLNPNGVPSGGELVELKDSRSYTIPSFNSTIPSGYKSIYEIAPTKTSKTYLSMQAVGDDVYSLESRAVYYLLRGRYATNKKICLVHGSFFETVPIHQLIQKGFAQMIRQTVTDHDPSLIEQLSALLSDLFSNPQNFNKVRQVEGASVSVRFRIMTEVNRYANLMNTALYPDISDDTLNLILPCSSLEAETLHRLYLQSALTEQEWNNLRVIRLTHAIDGGNF